MQSPTAEVVAPAKRDDATLARVAVELELAEGELADLREQFRLRGGGDEVGPVAESGRQYWCRFLRLFRGSKEVELRHLVHYRARLGVAILTPHDSQILFRRPRAWVVARRLPRLDAAADGDATRAASPTRAAAISPVWAAAAR